MVKKSWKESVQDRSTADLIVIFMSALIGVTILTGIIGVVLLAWIDPAHIDVNVLVNRIGNILNTLIGAIVGYVAGRGVTTVEHKINGNSKTDEPSPPSESPG